jgi:hypothetical protein
MCSVTAGANRQPVSELIMALPARLRNPFLLHYYAGFGVREIAVLLERPQVALAGGAGLDRSTVVSLRDPRRGPRRRGVSDVAPTPGTASSSSGPVSGPPRLSSPIPPGSLIPGTRARLPGRRGWLRPRCQIAGFGV